MKLNSIMGGAVAAALLVSSAFATDIGPAAAPLPAGKAAGTKDAALLGPNGFWIGLAIVAAVVVAVVASNGNKNNTTTPTTGTGS